MIVSTLWLWPAWSWCLVCRVCAAPPNAFDYKVQDYVVLWFGTGFVSVKHKNAMRFLAKS